MNDLVNKLLRLKTPIKAAVTVGVIGVIAAVYYFMAYVDLSDQITAGRATQAQLKTEKESYEKRKKEYVAYREELKSLQEEQRELLKALPKKAEIATFLQNMQEQADVSGLEVLNSNFDSEVPEDLYVKIPVRMDVRGTFHSLTKFFKNVSEMRRIVNIESLKLATERTAAESDAPPKLRVSFIAATFRYVEKGGT